MARKNPAGSVSLALAFAGFLFFTFQPWIPLASLRLFGDLDLHRLVLAFFEASLAGAVADWFAVTALFRDPLGIHLPHTSLLARNKDSIAEAVPRFIAHFVSDDLIARELARMDFAAKVSEALRQGGPRVVFHDFLRQRGAAFLSTWAESGGMAEARREATTDIASKLCVLAADRLDPVASFASLLQWASRKSFDERALELGAELLRAEIAKNRATLVSTITPIIKRNAGWQGLFIGRGTIESLLVGFEEELSELRSDRGNELRRFLLASLNRFASRLGGETPDPAGEGERIRALISEALRDPETHRGIGEMASGLLAKLGEDLERPDGSMLATLEGIEDWLADRLLENPVTRAGFNGAVSGVCALIVKRARLVESLADYLTGMLKASDATEFVARVEEAVYGDLQYIRVNGAVVGGLAGIVLALISALPSLVR